MTPMHDYEVAVFRLTQIIEFLLGYLTELQRVKPDPTGNRMLVVRNIQCQIRDIEERLAKLEREREAVLP